MYLRPVRLPAARVAKFDPVISIPVKICNSQGLYLIPESGKIKNLDQTITNRCRFIDWLLPYGIN